MPITAQVIKTVEALAEADGMKGLRIRSRTGQILYDSAWIAGVDYEDDADDEDYEPDRPDMTWPISRHWEELTSFRVDEEMDMDLVATIAECNGHPQWEERVQFLRDFGMKRWFFCRRSTIDQIVQQEWIGAG